MANNPPGYYNALIAKWPTVPGATEEEKLVNLNAETVPGPDNDLVDVPPSEIINCFDSADFLTIPSGDIQKLLLVLSGATVNVSKGSNIRKIILGIFNGKTATITNFQAFQDKHDKTAIPWWQANGYGGPISHNDLVAAGIVTEPAAAATSVVSAAVGSAAGAGTL